MSGTTQYGIKLFSDGANTKEMLAAINDGVVSGFTTNPTLMRKAGVANYEEFAKSMRDAIPKEYSISYEVISDELKEMGRQARKISSWGENIYVKIPITNTKGVSTTPLIEELSNDGLMLNITAILTIDQVIAVSKALSHDTPSIVSVLRWARCKCWCRPYGSSERNGQDNELQSPIGGPVGQPEGGPECKTGCGEQLPHHNDHAGHPEAARAIREGPDPILT